MKPNDFDLTLYDAGTHTLIDSVADPLVALEDGDALSALTGYLQVFLAQPGSLGIVANRQAMEAFVLHAQRVRIVDVEFLDASFDASVRQQVPEAPPVAPNGLWLSDGGGGVVLASSNLGSNADRYELQHLVGGQWATVGEGTVREDGSGVDYQATGISAGNHQFRVVARWGFFGSFPGPVAAIETA